MTRELDPGLYDRLVDRALREALERIEAERTRVDAVDEAEQPLYLARYVGEVLHRRLRAMKGKTVVEDREALVRAVLETIGDRLPAGPGPDPSAVDAPFEALREVRRAPEGLGSIASLPAPATPLGQSALLVNAPGEPSVGSELERELASADRVDAIVAFLKWSGVVRLRDALRGVIERGGAVRLITSTYTGASELRAVEALAEIGVEIRTSYDPRRTRLHAKAWFLHRRTGYSTAFIGSSNLSRSAMVDGLEWNVRLSRVEVPEVLTAFSAAFENYWSDPEFEAFRAGEADDSQRFERALRVARGGDGGGSSAEFFVDLRPWPYQEEILGALKVERLRHGRNRNLVVAATGTGKTVIAAIDYLRLCRAEKRRPSLLFVAHRKEILEQARHTFRHALRDGTFGELLVAGQRPADGEHVFASVQSLARIDLEDLPTDRFERVIVDEFHHAEAPTYRRLLDHLFPTPDDGRPQGDLLGLTATPERGDGRDVFRCFEGRIAAEIRLWDALARGLLCPFHYFGIHDGTDLSDIAWTRGKYDPKLLEKRLATDRARTALILEAVRDRCADPGSMRALGFCVSRTHARFMARAFSEAGLAAEALLGDDSTEDRSRIRRQLAEGALRAVFTVDLFNEGVDIPEIDTILFLRPTDSATVFLQQFGRGLRLTEGKSHLTVLDFVGQHRREYRFDQKLRALLGGTVRELERSIEDGFPQVPPGCALQLDRVAAELVLKNVREALPTSRPALVRELRALGPDVTLPDFLERTGMSLGELYGKDRSFTQLHRLAFNGPAPSKEEATILRALPRLLHIEDSERLVELREIASDVGGAVDERSERQERLWRALLSTLWPRQAIASFDAAVDTVRTAPDIAAELRALAQLLEEGARHELEPWHVLAPVPLFVHARYHRNEVMALFDERRKGKLLATQGGVLYQKESRTDLLFITLEKTEHGFSPTTRYNDYAMSADRFHWESQNSAHPESPTGRRYLSGESTVLLFVRERKHDSWGRTAPFTFLGPATLESAEGERPMQIVWRLAHPLPARIETTTVERA